MDLAELRRLACQGVPDDAGVRPVVWKVWELSRLLRIILFTVQCHVFVLLVVWTRSSVCSHPHARDMALAELHCAALILVMMSLYELHWFYIW